MDKKIQPIESQPNYKRIYLDILDIKYPSKKEKCLSILSKKKLSFLDVIALNNIIFQLGNNDKDAINHKHRSYDKSAIFEILDYQKKYQYSNTQLADHFKLSRNTITKWKKTFIV